MIKHGAISSFLFIAALAAPMLLHAATLQRNFSMGGKVLAGPEELQAGIVCGAPYGPFLTLPYNVAVPGPYFIRTLNRGTPRKNGHILALYSNTPDTSTCYNPETGAPVPAFEIKLYGVSR